MEKEFQSIVSQSLTNAKSVNKPIIQRVEQAMNDWLSSKSLSAISDDYSRSIQRKPDAFYDMTSFERVLMTEHHFIMLYPFFSNGLLPILVEAAQLGLRPKFVCELFLSVLAPEKHRIDPAFIQMLQNPSPELDFTTLYMFIREDKGHFVFSDSTVDELLHTDLSKSITSELFTLPYDLTYIRFGDTSVPSLPEEYGVYNEISGVHSLEACSVMKYYTSSETGSGGLVSFLYGDNVDVKDLSVYCITMLGFPKANLQDDAFHSFVLYIDPTDTKTPLQDILDKHYEYYRTLPSATRSGIVGIDHYAAKSVDFLTRCLVYLNFIEHRKTSINERSILQQKANRTLNKAKKRKLLKSIGRAKQRVLIDVINKDSSHPTPNKSAHWRRGHMRKQRYGENLSKVKVIKIERTLVGKSESTNTESLDTNYKVR